MNRSPGGFTMRPSRLFVPVAVACVAALAAGCSSSASTATTTSAVTTSTVATTTAPSTSAVTTTAAPATTATPTTPAPTAPPTTAPPTTAVPTTGAPTTTPAGSTQYTKVASPKVPTTHTDPFAVSGTLKDGGYWVEMNGGDAAGPTVTVYQAFFGAECQSKATEAGDECLNDIYIVADTRDVAGLKYAPGAVVTVSDPNTQQSFQITPAELVQVRTSDPSAGAPNGYAYAPFGFLMTVKGGAITRFEQVWTP
jgi:hypothetical protein